MSKDAPKEISANLKKVLDSHGYGFQYAVIRRSELLRELGHSRWWLDVVEFPVMSGDETTHIDFVLRSQSGDTIIVAECKRTDPAIARWCFARSPNTSRHSSPDEVIFEHLNCSPSHSTIRRPHFGHTALGVYHLGFELRTEVKGDGIGRNKSAIDTAITQVLRGESGLISYFHLKRKYSWSSSFPNHDGIRFIPTVFTTAQIWVTDVDLGAADLESGDLTKDMVKARPADWIWFNHNRSPRLSPDFIENGEKDDRIGGLSYHLQREFARSIAIVSVRGIDNFFCADLDRWIWPPEHPQLAFSGRS